MAQTTAQRKQNRKANRPEPLLALGVLGALLLLLGLGLGYVRGERANVAAGAFPGEIIATDRPLRAVHDMGAPAEIPFLPKGGPQPNVDVPATAYDFGRIGAQDVVRRTFLVRNNGDAPLTISRAYTTCGCTTATISASVIPPGQAATVELIFDVGFHDSAGQTVRRGVILEINDLEQPQAELWVQADVAGN
jgi:hypothetical protein